MRTFYTRLYHFPAAIEIRWVDNQGKRIYVQKYGTNSSICVVNFLWSADLAHSVTYSVIYKAILIETHNDVRMEFVRSDFFPVNQDERLSSPRIHNHQIRETKMDMHGLTQNLVFKTPSALVPNLYRGRCRYPSQRCDNERALKRNGQAHKLCEKHRKKQNEHQRKFDGKKSKGQKAKSVRIKLNPVSSGKLRITTPQSSLAGVYPRWCAPHHCRVQDHTSPSSSQQYIPFADNTQFRLSNRSVFTESNIRAPRAEASMAPRPTDLVATLHTTSTFDRERMRSVRLPSLSTNLFGIGIELHQPRRLHNSIKNLCSQAPSTLIQEQSAVPPPLQPYRLSSSTRGCGLGQCF